MTVRKTSVSGDCQHGLRAIAPLHVAAYIRTHPGSVPTVKQHLAAIRALCDWLVVHQVLPANPAAAVRGPKHVVTKGATPVLTPAEARALLDRIDTGDARRPPRPGAAERDGLQLRAGECGRGDAPSGLLPAGAAGVAGRPPPPSRRRSLTDDLQHACAAHPLERRDQRDRTCSALLTSRSGSCPRKHAGGEGRRGTFRRQRDRQRDAHRGRPAPAPGNTPARDGGYRQTFVL